MATLGRIHDTWNRVKQLICVCLPFRTLEQELIQANHVLGMYYSSSISSVLGTGNILLVRVESTNFGSRLRLDLLILGLFPY